MGPLFQHVMLIQDPWLWILSSSIPQGVLRTSYFGCPRLPLKPQSTPSLEQMSAPTLWRPSPLYFLLSQPPPSWPLYVFSIFLCILTGRQGNFLIAKPQFLRLCLHFWMSAEQLSLDASLCTSYFIKDTSSLGDWKILCAADAKDREL